MKLKIELEIDKEEKEKFIKDLKKGNKLSLYVEEIVKKNLGSSQQGEQQR